MPSGSKKRKAAKRKLQKSTHNANIASHSHAGVDDPKPHHGRESDSDEMKTSNNFNDVAIVSSDNLEESQKRNASNDRSSSSSSSSEDDEVKVEKDNSGQSSYSEPTPSNKTQSLPQELNSAKTDSVESQMEQNMNEILPLSDDQTIADTETLLPKDSNVTMVDRDGTDGLCKESEKNISSEEQPLVYTRPLPARRASWMNCCGLLDVLSGGSSR